MESSKLKYFLTKTYPSHFPDIITSQSPATIVFIYFKCIYFHSLLVFARTGQAQGEQGQGKLRLESRAKCYAQGSRTH